MEYYAVSKKGRREKNEDSYIAEKINNFYLFAVADGLGGHMGGGIASRIAIIELKETTMGTIFNIYLPKAHNS